jgi:hypothetical protein
MYKNIDFLPIILEKGNEEILKRRAFLNHAFTFIESYASKQRLIVSSVNRLLGLKLSPQDYFMNIFTENVLQHAAEIVRQLSADGTYTKVEFMMLLANYEIRISIDTMIVARLINNLYEGPDKGFRRDKQLSSIYPIISLKGQFSPSNVLYMPVEIELVEHYRNMYDPTKCSQWEELINKEASLFAELGKSTIKFGGDTGGDIGRDMRETCSFMQDDSIYDNVIGGKEESNLSRTSKVCQKILDDVASSEDAQYFILLPSIARLEAAINVDRKDKYTINDNKLTMISSLPFENIEKIVNNILNEMDDVKVLSIIQTPKIPYDFRLRKYSFYFLYDNMRVLFLEVYNSLSYELIPYIPDDLLSSYNTFRIAHPYVMLRYHLIDLLIINLTRVEENEKRSKWNRKMEVINKVHNISEAFLDKHSSLVIPDVSIYVGIYEDQRVEMKRLQSKARDLYKERKKEKYAKK